MGFLKKSMKGEGLVDDSSGNSGKEDFEASGYEKDYMEMFPKIGRDFIHKEDLYRILDELLDILGIDEFEIDRSESSALQRAEEYKHFLRTGQSGNSHYPDLIKGED